MSAPERGRGLSEDHRKLLEEFCESFERALREDPPASMEEVLAEMPPQIRDRLSADLLKIKLQCEYPATQTLNVAESGARFSDQGSIVSQVVEETHQDTETGVPPGERESKAGALDDTNTFPSKSAFSRGAPRRQSDQRVAETIGSTIGPYQLLHRLGEGGMGSVYLAQQREPVERQVALKIIKLGMDSEQVIARFEAERQALAMMNHNSIARVLDAGTSSTGQPFFVMELVKGAPITKYAEQKQLAVSDRLGLFVDVCRAVQHAHQKGIIHRDIKPSNVLVSESDGSQVAKVIDFGIAKATGRQLTDKTIVTELGQVIGTLEYMSPEQAGLNPLDIDTRSDVYSLGVLLYELLTGTTPISRKRLRELDLTSMLRAVREFEPPRPSTRLSESANSVGSGSATDKTRPDEMSRHTRGDLDWIVMKALEKDRGRRYESAGAFADDIERYLSNETVEARPATVGYRLGKFIRRNKTAVGATAIVTLALLLATVISTWQAFVARRALTAEQTANETAQNRLRQLSKVNDILASIFRDLDPNQEERGGPPLLVQLGERLDEATDLIDGEAIGDRQMVAGLQFTLGRTQRSLGESPKAVELLTKALDARRTELGADDPKTLKSMAELAHAYRGVGNMEEAVSLYEQVYERRRAKLGANHRDSLVTLSRLAGAHGANGDLKKGLRMQQEAYEALQQSLGEEDEETIVCLSNLAYQTFDMNDKEHDEQAERLYERAVKLLKEHYGANHHKTLMAIGSLGAVYLALGKHDEALHQYEHAYEQLQEKLGSNHSTTLISGCSLAYAYDQAGQSVKGLHLLAENVEKLKQKLGAEHPRSLGYMNLLGYSYEQNDQVEKAIEVHSETHRAREKALGRDHPETLSSLCNLGWCHRRLGQYEDSIRCYRQALPGIRTKYGRDHPRAISALGNFGRAALEGEHFVEAQEIYRECVQLREAKVPDNWETFRDKSRLGAALLGQKKFAAAEPLLLAAYEGLQSGEDKPPSDSTALVDAIRFLVDLYEARDADGDKEQAEKWKSLLK